MDHPSALWGDAIFPVISSDFDNALQTSAPL
jgi:hypothetical protein